MTLEADPVATPILGSPDGAAPSPQPLPLPQLAASVVLIAASAVTLAALLSVLVLLASYAVVGVEGLTELYQDLRFDMAFKTEVGAVVVGTFYASVATATIAAAWWRGGRGWRALIGWAPVGGSHLTISTIIAATLAYAGIVTLLLTVAQHRPVINVEGPTNYLLLITFATNLVVLAPCAEELFFRGWLFTGLRRRLAFWPTLLTTAALFAAMHWDMHRPRVLLVLPLALAAGFVRELADSVKPAVALHMAYNLVIVTVKLWET